MNYLNRLGSYLTIVSFSLPTERLISSIEDIKNVLAYKYGHLSENTEEMNLQIENSVASATSKLNFTLFLRAHTHTPNVSLFIDAFAPFFRKCFFFLDVVAVFFIENQFYLL